LAIWITQLPDKWSSAVVWYSGGSSDIRQTITGCVNFFVKQKEICSQNLNNEAHRFMDLLSLMRKEGDVKMMVKLPLCSVKHHVMMAYRGVEIKRYPFVTSALD
jgi:hypothetical protein